MKHLSLLTVIFVLCISTALAGRDRRQEKLAEEQAGRDAAVLAQSFAQLPRLAGILDWAPFDISSATSRYKGIEWTAGGVVWINGFDLTGTTYYAYKSTDNGGTWTKVPMAVTTGAAAGVTSICAKDANVALVGNDLGQLFRTTDGGGTWNKVFEYIDQYAFMDQIVAIGTSRDTMLCFGDADTGGVLVIRSIDAGATWTRIKPAVGDSINESQWYAGYYTYGQMADVVGRKVWASWYYGSSQDPRILVTPDAGQTWEVYQDSLPGGHANAYYFKAISFGDANNGWGVIRQVAAGSANWAVKTTNGGKTWSDTINVEPGVAHSESQVLTVKQVRGTANVFAGGFNATGEKAWWSADSGKTWTKLNIPPGPSANATIYNSLFKDATHGFAIGREQNLKLSPATAVNEGSVALPGAYALGQNYPNPFNPATTIGYTIAKEGNVHLAVYDVLGRLVATLADGVQAAGPHTVGFDGSRLSSGVYYYTLKAGEFTATRSLVLMK